MNLIIDQAFLDNIHLPKNFILCEDISTVLGSLDSNLGTLSIVLVPCIGSQRKVRGLKLGG